MSDIKQDGDLDAIADDNTDAEFGEDQFFGSLDEAVAMLKDDSDVEEEPEEEASDDDTEEPEDEEASEDEDGDDDDSEEPESEDDVTVTLDGGEQIPLSELKNGYFRQKDYTAKTTELANDRKAAEALREEYVTRQKSVETTLQNLSNYLQGLVPPEPSLSLAQSNPSQYQYERALRENAIAELGQVIQMQEEAVSEGQGFSAEEINRMKAAEQEKLVKAMPHLADPGRRVAFDAAVKETAQKFGFTEDEIAQTADSRILQLVHFAGIGKRAVENRANAKRRVETPKKGRTKASKAPPARNRQAMQRLSKSGSIDDALAVDFD
jgi:hypothetical protein